MIQKTQPNTIKEVMASISLPKGIERGGNTKGLEILDREGMEGEVEEDKEANYNKLLEALQSKTFLPKFASRAIKRKQHSLSKYRIIHIW